MGQYIMRLNEIERIPPYPISGLGDTGISGEPLPGGKFEYSVGKNKYNGYTYITILRQGQEIASLTITKSYVIPNAFKVSEIKVHSRYRGQGLAKALYGIALTKLKVTLLAGSSQSPGGRRNWLSLSKIPGCEVFGYILIHDTMLNETVIDEIMHLGGEYYCKGRNDYHVFLFKIAAAGANELMNARKVSNIKLYDEPDDYITGLMARWTGA
jgi:GNAT superfamily N-acetyltransferase